MSGPSNCDWDMITFAQGLSQAVRKSDNLRTPRNPERVLTLMQGRLAQIRYERERGRG